MTDNNDPLFTSVFIGNTGVGKTSILSAMYMALDDANLPAGLSLLPKTEDEFQLLKNKWQEMKRHIRKQGFGTTIQKPLYQGSKGCTNHDFVLTGDPSDNDSGLPLRIWDSEGGYTANTDASLIEKVARSFVVMCAVDSTFLMEFDDPGINEEMNEVRSIKQILERALNRQDNGILSVFFLLTKCEKYMKTDDSRNRMAGKFNEAFRSVLELLRQKDIMVHYLPVQTMGCVELARIEECDDGSWTQEFQVVLGKEFNAKDAVQPLSLLLQLSLRMLDMIQQKQWEDRPLWERLWDIITFQDAPGRLDGLVQAIAEHFGEPKDWRTNRNGELAEVILVNQ